VNLHGIVLEALGDETNHAGGELPHLDGVDSTRRRFSLSESQSRAKEASIVAALIASSS
jgi:hypothetical protein